MKKLSEDELLECLDEVYNLIHPQAYQQIKEMIQKLAVTEEWMAKKARELYRLQFRQVGVRQNLYLSDCKDFIRSLVEEMG